MSKEKIGHKIYLALQKYGWVVKDRRRSLVLAPKLLLALLYARIKDVPGVIAECGVAKGESLSALKLLSMSEGKNRPLYGFDTFKGLPAPVEGEHGKAGQFGYSEEDVRDYFRYVDVPMEGVTFISGDVHDTLASFKEPIAFLHVDVDLYEGHKVILERLWPQVSKGGIVLFDDYGNRWDGATKAIDEFVAANNLTLEHAPFAGRAYLVKG